MRLFDAHCHLQDDRLAPRVASVLRAAHAAGVEGFLCCGVDEHDWDAVLTLAARHPEIVPALGLHPWRIGTRSPSWRETLRRRLEEHPRAAVGEIGLDHALLNRRDEEQMEVFIDQMRLASERGRPASIHCRRAWGALREALAEVGPLRAGFVVHAYSGSVESLDWILAVGGSISFAGPVVSDRNRRIRAAAQAVPVDRLLVETDAPDLMPRLPGESAPESAAPAAEGPNEPALLPLILRAVADLRGVTPEEIAEMTWQNARRLFSLNIEH